MAASYQVRFRPNWRDATVRAVLPQLEQIRSDIEADMKTDAAGRAFDTGAYMRSLYAKLDRRSGQITAGARVKYAVFIEYGFRHWRSGKLIPARPIVRDAIRKHRRVVR